MTKVYVFFLDSSASKLLVGTGGTVGRNASPRVGYHLPGGSVEVNKKRLASAEETTLYILYDNIVDEVQQEFGSLAETLFSDAQNITKYFYRTLTYAQNGKQVSELVYFFRFNINANFAEGYPKLVTGGKEDPRDSHFKSVEVLSLSEASEKFSKHWQTSWFKEGVDILIQQLNDEPRSSSSS